MPILLDIELPTFRETLQLVRRALTAEYTAVNLSAFTRTNLLYPFGIVVARVSDRINLKSRESASQATPFGATGANKDEWLSIYGITIPPPVIAELTVDVTSTGAASVPAGTELASVDGEIYTTDTLLTFLIAETQQVGVTAGDVGAVFNREVGDVLELQLLLQFLNPGAVVVSLDTAGSDPADDDDKTQLIQARLSQSNTAGTAADYRLKTLQVDLTFNEVFIVEAGKGAGTVAIYPTVELDATTQAPYEVNLPTGGQITAVQAFFDELDANGNAINRQVNDRVFAIAITKLDYTFDVTITPDNASTRIAVTDAIGNRLAEDFSAKGYTIANSEIVSAIGNAEGITSSTLNDVNGQGAAADVVAAVGELANLLAPGGVTFS